MKKVIIVSGASKGLGLEVVRHLIAHDYCVAAYSRYETPAIMQLKRENPNFHWACLDARDSVAQENFVKTVVKRFGEIFGLVNNAGMAVEGFLTLTPVEAISECIQVNLQSTILLTRAVTKSMLRGGAGSIINISSVNAIRGHAGVSVYSAVKSALDGFTRSLAKELGPAGIRINSIAPGYFESEMVEGMPDAKKHSIEKRTPLKRLAKTEDLANSILFLLSEKANFITGQVITVDGGISC